MEICCNIINVFTVTFIQLNAYLLNKIITIIILNPDMKTWKHQLTFPLHI